jgi:4-diphosphocytidyl-2-C-methyl-D-erythritol kinase
LPEGSPAKIAREGRNDLERSAIAQVPQIADVMVALRCEGAWLSRMSGSGATCFGLFEDGESCEAASAAIAQAQPDWWQMKGQLR